MPFAEPVIRGAIQATLLAALAMPVGAVDIFHCRDADGAVTLTDVPCTDQQTATVVSIAVSDAPGEGLRAGELKALEAMEAAMAQRRSIRASQLIANTSRVSNAADRTAERERRYPVLVSPLVGRPGHVDGRRHCRDCGVPPRRRPAGVPRPGLQTPDLFSTPARPPHRTVIHGRVNF